MSLFDLINKEELHQVAGDRSYYRGVKYFDSGCVKNLREYQGKITATVSGTQNYRVRLWENEGELDYSCSCPVGEDYRFCKHCVAVGLSWIEGKQASAKETGNKNHNQRNVKTQITPNDIRRWLGFKETDLLAEIIMTQAIENEQFYRKLMVQYTGDVKGEINVDYYKKALQEAIIPDEYIHYNEVWDYMRGIVDILDTITGLLKIGRAVEVVELVEYALRLVENAFQYVDDSDGRLGDILEQLQCIHFNACHEAKPDREQLAKRLFQWELEGEWDVFSGAAKTYARILGEEGLNVYRELAEAEWRKMKLLNTSDNEKGAYGRHFNITAIMESLAKQSGDIDALIAIKQQDLSHAYAFFQIAQICKDSGRHNEALDWAERGLKNFSKSPDPRLQDFIAAEYHRRKRHDEAMTLIWPQFESRPCLELFKKLKQHATRAKKWTDWRQRAIDFLEDKIKKEPQRRNKKSRFLYGRNHRESLVEIYLWEKDYDTAWSLAKDGDFSEHLWLRLAAIREQDNPEDAIAIYKRIAESNIEETNNEAYARAGDLLKRIQKLKQGLQQNEEFRHYLSQLSHTYKRKRNFINMIEKLG